VDEYLTVQEVADQLRVSKMTIYRMCHAGTIPNLAIGGQFRIPRSDLAVWLDERRTTVPQKEN
jgi:excisionase family DNA binding protein